MSKRREAILVLINEAYNKCVCPKGFEERSYNRGTEDVLTYIIEGLKRVHW